MLAFFPEFGVHECKLASMALGGILTQATLLLIYQSAGLLMSEKRAFWTGVLAVFFLPFYYYAQIAYTDVSGMFALALFICICKKNAKL